MFRVSVYACNTSVCVYLSLPPFSLSLSVCVCVCVECVMVYRYNDDMSGWCVFDVYLRCCMCLFVLNDSHTHACINERARYDCLVVSIRLKRFQTKTSCTKLTFQPFLSVKHAQLLHWNRVPSDFFSTIFTLYKKSKRPNKSHMGNISNVLEPIKAHHLNIAE